jgi:hypothetical protein
VTWERAHLRNNAAVWQRVGMAIWQLDRGQAAVWHRVYTFENPLTNSPETVEGFRVTTGDISGDGRPEVLVFFDSGGSAGNGTYHLFANSGYRLRQPLVMPLSNDDGAITFAKHALVVRRGLDHRGAGIHCCFRRVRTTILRWNGNHLTTVQRTVGPNLRGWPAG